VYTLKYILGISIKIFLDVYPYFFLKVCHFAFIIPYKNSETVFTLFFNYLQQIFQKSVFLCFATLKNTNHFSGGWFR
jgi:hypothetical protein